MKKLIPILLLLTGCAAIQQGINSKLWPPPKADTRGEFTLKKFAEGDYGIVTKSRVERADVALFRYTCLYPDIAQQYSRVGIDNEPVPVAADTMRTDCRNILQVEMEIINNPTSKHAKNAFVVWRVPIAEWIKKYEQ